MAPQAHVFIRREDGQLAAARRFDPATALGPDTRADRLELAEWAGGVYLEDGLGAPGGGETIVIVEETDDESAVDGIQEAHPGDWIVKADGHADVTSGDDFELCYAPISAGLDSWADEFEFTSAPQLEGSYRLLTEVWAPADEQHRVLTLDGRLVWAHDIETAIGAEQALGLHSEPAVLWRAWVAA